jgi:hypothetical protein
MRPSEAPDRERPRHPWPRRLATWRLHGQGGAGMNNAWCCSTAGREGPTFCADRSLSTSSKTSCDHDTLRSQRGALEHRGVSEQGRVDDHDDCRTTDEDSSQSRFYSLGVCGFDLRHPHVHVVLRCLHESTKRIARFRFDCCNETFTLVHEHDGYAYDAVTTQRHPGTGLEARWRAIQY